MKKLTHWAARPKEVLRALASAAYLSNADLTQVIGRDENEELLFVAVYARGEDAVALERWTKRRNAQ